MYGLSSSGRKHKGVKYIKAKTKDYPSLIRELKPDVILNTSAITSHEYCERNKSEAYQINADLAGILSSEARKVKSQFIHISTDAVYEGNSDRRYNEKDNTQPNSIYGMSKLGGEKKAIKENGDALIVRTNFFGWSKQRNQGILDFFNEKLRKEEQIIGFSDYIVNSMYMGDLADILVILSKNKKSGIVNVGSSEALSKYEFGLKVAYHIGKDANLIIRGIMIESPNIKAKRGRNISMNVEKIEKEIGFAMKNTDIGLSRAFKERDALYSYLRHTEENSED